MAAFSLFPTDKTPLAASPRELGLLKLQEQTGNVYENKRPVWKTGRPKRFFAPEGRW
jgi:hypothetical protein